MIRNRLTKLLFSALSLALLLFLFLQRASVSSQGEMSGPETFDVIFVIDNSGSMGPNPYEAPTDPDNLRIAVVRAMVDLLSIDCDEIPTRIGVITFGSQAILLENNAENPLFECTDQSVRNLIQPANQGYTIIGDAFEGAYDALDRAGTFNGDHLSAVVFLTDGQPADRPTDETTPADTDALFDDAEVWVEHLKEQGTRVYITTINKTGQPYSEDRWQHFADITGGEYAPVESITDALAFFNRIVARAILDLFVPEHEQNLLIDEQITIGEVFEKDFEVSSLVSRLVVVAVRTDPLTDIALIQPDGIEVNVADPNVLVRGGNTGDLDVVYSIIRPQAGNWRLVFNGGEGHLLAWYYWRPFEINVVSPKPTVLQSPDSLLPISVQLLEKLPSSEEITTFVGDIQDDSAVMTLKITDPNGTVQVVQMAYDSESSQFQYILQEPTISGVYLLQFVLQAGQFTVATREATVSVGRTPTIDTVSVFAIQDNSFAGLQTDEVLGIKVILNNIVEALSGSLIIEPRIIREDNGVVLLEPLVLEPGTENAFVGHIPLLQPGSYQLVISLSGKTRMGVQFGSFYEEQPIENTSNFSLTVPPTPTSTPTATPTPTPIPPQLNVDVSREFEINQNIPFSVSIENPSGLTLPPVIAGLQLSTQVEPISTRILTTTQAASSNENVHVYNDAFPSITSLGNYTIQVSIPDMPDVHPVEYGISVLRPFWQRILMGIVKSIGVIALVVFLYWFFFRRPLAPRAVIGTLTVSHPKLEEPKEYSLSQYASREITLGRDGIIALNDDESVTGLRARLLARQDSDRRTLLAPCIVSTDNEHKVTLFGVAVPTNRQDAYILRNNDEINIGAYKLVYKDPGN